MQLPFRFTHKAVISKYTRAKLFSKAGTIGLMGGFAVMMVLDTALG